jgi:hypothetical protein
MIFLLVQLNKFFQFIINNVDILFNNKVKTNIDVKRNGIFIISEFCILGDCSQKECHNCFPVKGCKKHIICIEEGTCSFIPIK